jgi:FtsH-binding integral membrane protein
MRTALLVPLLAACAAACGASFSRRSSLAPTFEAMRPRLQGNSKYLTRVYGRNLLPTMNLMTSTLVRDSSAASMETTLIPANAGMNDHAAGRTLRSFQDRSSRLGFIRKVFSIVFAQLLTTATITYLMVQHRSVPAFLMSKGSFSIITLAAAAMTCILALTSPSIRYNTTQSLGVLGIFTLCQSTLVGLYSSQFPLKTVFMGSAHTLFALLGVMLYSFQPNPAFDLTVMGSWLFSGLLSLTFSSFASLFFGISFFENFLLGGGAALFVAYMVYDVQMIVGGKKVNKSYSERDYILASLNLYMDIINLLIRLIEIADRMQKNK